MVATHIRRLPTSITLYLTKGRLLARFSHIKSRRKREQSMIHLSSYAIYCCDSTASVLYIPPECGKLLVVTTRPRFFFMWIWGISSYVWWDLIILPTYYIYHNTNAVYRLYIYRSCIFSVAAVSLIRTRIRLCVLSLMTSRDEVWKMLRP